ncbi:MAG: hypothetical protein ACI9EF_002736 [Pseudohongiellaceae bacterium]|jgi:hypothetical protein
MIRIANTIRGALRATVPAGLVLILSGSDVSAQALTQIELQPFPGDSIAGLNASELDRFEKGFNEFTHALSSAEGLGPIFNDSSCSQCHALPVVGGFSSSAVTRFGKAATGMFPFDPLDNLGGSLLQDQTIDLACAEFVPPEADVTTFRTTPHLFGLGLIEAIPDADIIDLRDNPPHPSVAGVVHMVAPLEGGPAKPGRFGWKSQVPTVLTFSADASLNEMGLTNRFVTTENAPNGDLVLLAACDNVADPEDGPDGEGFDRIDRQTDFQRFLAAPPQTPQSGMAGEALFSQVSCNACHVESFTTGTTAEAALTNVTFKPFSDFLLHATVGDGIAQGAGTEGLMRTAPLWGLGQRAGIGLLHDGSATGGAAEANIHTAILAHDGEGAFSSSAYAALNGTQQAELQAFLMSLGRAEFDIEGNSTVDEIDWFFLQAFGHFTGPDIAGTGLITPDDDGAVADVDQDGDFDLVDFGYMQRAFTGALP